MKTPATICFFLTLCLSASVSGQSSKFLEGVEPSENVLLHLETVKRLKEDTAHILSAIPMTSPSFGEERAGAPQHFPYPVIFIHGLTGSSDTWAGFYDYALAQGWSFGGQLAFNLNSDDDLEYSNIYNGSPIDFADFNNGIMAGDFYIVNFNTGLDGTAYGSNYNTATQSNQAAIAKQGLAVRNAINHVLQATGKEKVILLGHSMGGLAARQYLQNDNFWQQDGSHHVAKLITSGTPHGGSNSTGTFLFDAFLDVDERSDAVRDLRRSYFYSFDEGVFLYGGLESGGVIFDNLLGFYNIDVDCNGVEGNQVAGLNQKGIPGDVDYSCIIGDWTYDISIDDPGDGVVEVEDAQLKNFYNITSETFTRYSDESPSVLQYTLHTALPDYQDLNIHGLDEPDYYHLSYQIESNTQYNGFITQQAPDAEYGIDYDDFIFTLPQAGAVSVKVDNVSTSFFGVSILGHPNYEYLFDEEYETETIQTQPLQLPAGTYYLEFYADGEAESWQYPYSFQLAFSPNNPSAVVEIDESIQIIASPNPVSDMLRVSISLRKSTSCLMQLQNQLGQTLLERSIEGSNIDELLDMTKYPSGTYFVTVSTSGGVKTEKVVKKGR
jgi:pimeloyl-ACP methyl ester carboxylesterase